MNNSDLFFTKPWLLAEEHLKALLEKYSSAPSESFAELDGGFELPTSLKIDSGVAIISVSGPIFRYTDIFSCFFGGTGLDRIQGELELAQQSPEVSSVVMVYDSPGGTSVGLPDLVSSIRDFPKSVTAYVEGSALSAAYWLASAAEEVVASPTSFVGSIGAVVSYFNDPDSKVIEIVSSQSPYKRSSPETKEGRALYQSLADSLADVFIRSLADLRDVSKEVVLDTFGQGAMVIAEDALSRNMIDALGSLQGVVQPISEVTAMTDKTLTFESLQKDSPELVAQIRDAAISEAGPALRKEGADAERARIQGVLAQALPGHAELIEGLAFDGETTPEQAALKVLEAEKGLRENAREGFAGSLNPVVSNGQTLSGDSSDSQDFPARVQALRDTGVSHGAAIKQVAKDHPKLHQQWLESIS